MSLAALISLFLAFRFAAWAYAYPISPLSRSCFAGHGAADLAGSGWGRNGRRRVGASLSMGLDIKIRIVGRKNGCEQWLEDAYSMYETRLRPSNIGVETIWHKNDDELVKGVLADHEKGHTVVLLDPLGSTTTSERFSENMYRWLDEGGSRLAFVIGGADGLPPELRYGDYNTGRKKGGRKKGNVGTGGSPYNLISLSALTFTHQFARTILMEQIYRASEIRKGSGYHK